MKNRNFKKALFLSFLLINNVASADENFKNFKKKSYSSDILKVVSEVVGITILGVGGKCLYDNKIKNNPDELPKTWAKDILLLNASRAYGYSQIVSENLNGKKVDMNGKYKYLFDEELMKKEGISNKPEVINIFDAICKLYVELSNNEKIKKMKFNPDYILNKNLDMNEVRGRRVISSIVSFVATPWIINDNGVIKWNLKTDFNGVPLISCNMPDNRQFEYIIEIKDDYNQIIKCKAIFKKENGELNFEKVEFLS